MDEDVVNRIKILEAEIKAKFEHSRERSLALTKLEECGLWLLKAAG